MSRALLTIDFELGEPADYRRIVHLVSTQVWTNGLRDVYVYLHTGPARQAMIDAAAGVLSQEPAITEGSGE